MLPSRAVSTGELVDQDAIEIGELYRHSDATAVEAVRERLECGRRLNVKKEEVGHGNWVQWLASNERVLGFGERSARMMMNAAKRKLTSDLTPETAIEISRKMWGNSAPHVSHNSGNNEWYTPAPIIEAARQTMGGIDLDPASSPTANKIVGADQIFTSDEDGLSQEWHGCVWLNPPYAQPLVAQFAKAVADKYARDEIQQACILVNNATETDWFRSMAIMATGICFLDGRVKFLDENLEPAGAPLQGQAVIYMGENLSMFAKHFSALGLVVAPV